MVPAAHLGSLRYKLLFSQSEVQPAPGSKPLASVLEKRPTHKHQHHTESYIINRRKMIYIKQMQTYNVYQCSSCQRVFCLRNIRTNNQQSYVDKCLLLLYITISAALDVLKQPYGTTTSNMFITWQVSHCSAECQQLSAMPSKVWSSSRNAPGVVR